MVHVPSKHMFKMQQICAYTMAWRCPCSTLTPQQAERKTEEKKEAEIVRKQRAGDKSRQKWSCGLSHFDQCVCLLLQMNGRCYKVGY